ncbi:MAG: 50S ribosomal protein L35 [Clostridia bacterium]
MSVILVKEKIGILIVKNYLYIWEYPNTIKEEKIMPKLKTNKAAKKRYSYTATGKVKRTKSNRRHLLANKTPRAKARGKVQDAYADKTCEAGIKRLLPYGNK